MDMSGTVIISGGHLQWSNIFKGTVFLWNKQLHLSLFQWYWVYSQFQLQSLFHGSTWSNPYVKDTVTAKHPLQFSIL